MVDEGVSRGLSVALRGVTQRFGTTWVLRGVDADFDSGTITVIEGSNGAGKSTLLSVVGGLLRPTAGTVRLVPENVDVAERRRELGWVGHESSCYRDLTARENVAFSARLQAGHERNLDYTLSRVGAEGFANQRVALLSRGQKQRVALARAVVHRPSLLLLDEPFTGLDDAGTAMLETILLEEAGRGTIVLVVSHDRDLASRLQCVKLQLSNGRASRVFGLSQGVEGKRD